jgi:hypothetical protein
LIDKSPIYVDFDINFKMENYGNRVNKIVESEKSEKSGKREKWKTGKRYAQRYSKVSEWTVQNGSGVVPSVPDGGPKCGRMGVQNGNRKLRNSTSGAAY